MEPRREQQKAPPPGAEPKRFRVIKLEERIAPDKGGAKTYDPKCLRWPDTFTCKTTW